jgi:glycosyltransferase involved in cell wall biosynthesis
LREEPLFQVLEAKGGTWSFDRFDAVANSHTLYYMYGHFKHSYEIFRAALRLTEYKQFDVIHATGIEFMTASLLLKKYSGTIPPVVMELSAANFSFSTYPGSIVKRSYKVFQREVFRTTLGQESKGIAVLGEWHRDTLREQLRLKNDFEIAVIPDGGEEPEQPIDRESAKSRIELSAVKEPILLFLGTLRHDKGLECLIEAVARLRNLRFTLVIAGHPQEYSVEQVTALIKGRGIEDKVITRLYYLDEADIPYYFYACDALILPYPRIYTGGSGPLMKGACVHRRPSIVSEVSEMGRLVQRHEIGLVARPEDPGDLADKITDFLKMPGETKLRMGANALALAREHTWDKMALRYTVLYRKVM